MLGAAARDKLYSGAEAEAALRRYAADNDLAASADADEMALDRLLISALYNKSEQPGAFCHINCWVPRCQLQQTRRGWCPVKPSSYDGTHILSAAPGAAEGTTEHTAEVLGRLLGKLQIWSRVTRKTQHVRRQCHGCHVCTL